MKKHFEASTDVKAILTMVIAILVLVGVLCLAWGIYRIYSGSDAAKGWSFLFLAALQFLAAWLNAATLTTTQLVLSPAQLEFYSPGLALVTSWDNLERIGKQSIFFGAVKYDSLVLQRASTQTTAWWLKFLRKQPERRIPMSMFSNWRVSEIGQEIKKYAPHLFSDDSSFK